MKKIVTRNENNNLIGPFSNFDDVPEDKLMEIAEDVYSGNNGRVVFKPKSSNFLVCVSQGSGWSMKPPSCKFRILPKGSKVELIQE